MNRFELIGRIAKMDFGMVGANSVPRLNITIAVDKNNRKSIEEKNKNLPQDQQQPTADFVHCTAWNDLGKNMNTWFAKGDWIYVQGHIQNQPQQKAQSDANGNRIWRGDNYIIDRFEFVSSKKDRDAAHAAAGITTPGNAAAAPAGAQRGGYAAAPKQAAPQQAPYMNAPQPASQPVQYAAPQQTAYNAAVPQPTPQPAYQSAPQQQYSAVPDYPTAQYGFIDMPDGEDPFGA